MFTVRNATADDAAELCGIYSRYVEQTAVSMEYAAPSLDEFRARIVKTLEKYPYLVLEDGGNIIGYAYAGPFHPRAAFFRASEVTVYVRYGERRKGAGRALYDALEARLREQGITNTYACIAFADNEDEYLTNDSMRFHERMGFRLVGKFDRCAFKFGRWYSIIWMEKIIAEH